VDGGLVLGVVVPAVVLLFVKTRDLPSWIADPVSVVILLVIALSGAMADYRELRRKKRLWFPLGFTFFYCVLFSGTKDPWDAVEAIVAFIAFLWVLRRTWWFQFG
jgi:UDP-N-acetylmuramyl pentapeptide phosphotransferase/UDP-N-acetylglucosamine-1-phosphate transferase